ncbi:MAG: tocopherol cyclase family protein [Melioribacteraceae bacterium]|nr:tocopherol cyclase family protein [Melioribacteraceae bacterium]MCF8265545.1 tocopherol cyclase family protein [Melioribacteraceae bacterium]MCF8432040.1 tocopherol cyclase family protein [Melioribacteraceae bacterium]
MFEYLSKIGKPEVYHGAKKKSDFFEGWFYKIVSPDEKNILAVIPGIFLSADKSKEHSFIQILDGKNHESFYLKYDKNDFRFTADRFEIEIGNSFFSDEKLILDLDSDNLNLKGSLFFNNQKEWPKTLLSPGIMGWYSYVPFMECNHGIISLNHSVNGELTINGAKITFDGGKGYGEKDWGSSFPSSYVWMQTNHFDDPTVSFTGSVAKIPWLFSSFRGFIIGLLIGEKLYKFATYTGAVLDHLKVNENYTEFKVHDKKHILIANAERTKGGLLHGPYENEMTQRVSESLDSKIKVKLVDRKSGKIIFEGEGKHAGLDINGKLEEIVD